MKEVKILGSGCRKCDALERKVRELVKENNLDLKIEKTDDLKELIKHGIMMTPAIIIGGEVKSYGIIPGDDKLLQWLKEAQNA